jgi:hypothetical protein
MIDHCQRPSHARYVLVALLAGLGSAHVAKGLYFLAVQQPAFGIADLRNRRIENAYFLDGVSPLSQQSLAVRPRDPDRWAAGADVRWSHGVESARGALPPWAYPLQLVVAVQGREQFARVYLACLDLAALAVVAWLAYARIAQSRADLPGSALVVLSPLAIGATNSAMTQGQNSLIVNAALALVLAALNRRPARGRAMSAGVAFAFAMSKPSSAVLFALAVAARRRWLLLIACAGVLTAATWFAAWWLHQSIAFQFEQFERLSRWVVNEGANPALNALTAVTSAQLARNVFGIAGIAVSAATVRRLRHASAYVVFAVLAVVARLFTYHRDYDDVLLAFLMIELAGRAWARGAALRWQFAWLLGGASVWLPYSWYVSPWAQVCQIVTWCSLAAALIASENAKGADSNPLCLSATGSAVRGVRQWRVFRGFRLRIPPSAGATSK